MGRDLFRGKTLIVGGLLLLAAGTSPLFCGESAPVPEPAEKMFPLERSRAVEDFRDYLEPLQHHAGPKYSSFSIPLNASVENEIRKLSTAGGKKWLSTCLGRAIPYRAFIQSRIREYGVPEEFFYLPVIESTYVPTAVSRSGAAGLWQFMPNSISPFGMEVNEWVDERFDFWKSTEASLQKLQENYRYFGDWYLAIGAYNCGLGRMSRIIRDTGIRDFWVLAQKGHLPAETARYVPKFLAVAHMASHAVKYGLDIRWEKGIEWDRVFLEKAVDLSLLSEASGIPLDVFRKGNTELRYNVTPPEGSSYYLKVPREHAQNVRNVLSDPGKKLLSFYLHKVQSGDTLSGLSRHFGVSVSMIAKYNPGVKPDRLHVGQQILVPSLKKVSPYVREIDVEELKTFTGVYTVTSGDTFWSIARRFETTPEKIAAANGLSINTPIRPGISLNVPEKESDY